MFLSTSRKALVQTSRRAVLTGRNTFKPFPTIGLHKDEKEKGSHKTIMATSSIVVSSAGEYPDAELLSLASSIIPVYMHPELMFLGGYIGASVINYGHLIYKSGKGHLIDCRKSERFLNLINSNDKTATRTLLQMEKIAVIDGIKAVSIIESLLWPYNLTKSIVMYPYDFIKESIPNMILSFNPRNTKKGE